MEGTGANWRKSSYSGANGGQCVEVGTAARSVDLHHAEIRSVVVRDTTNRAGAALAFQPSAWRTLLAKVRAS
jgi:hypothetical protein